MPLVTNFVRQLDAAASLSTAPPTQRNVDTTGLSFSSANHSSPHGAASKAKKTQRGNPCLAASFSYLTQLYSFSLSSEPLVEAVNEIVLGLEGFQVYMIFRHLGF